MNRLSRWLIRTGWKPMPQFSSQAAKILNMRNTVDSRNGLRGISVRAMASGGFLPLLCRAMIGICVLLFTLTSTASAQAPDVADRPVADGEGMSIEQEVLGNILRQPLGDTTVESLDLPQPFLRRAAGRIIRSSYQHRYHVVAADGQPSSPSNGATLKPPYGSSPSVRSTMATDHDPSRPSSNTWLYLIGLGILIGTAAGALALRRTRRARP